MATTSTAQQIAEQIAQLTPENQTKVFEFARALVASQTEPPVAVWRRLAALFPPEDLAEIERIVNEEHERALTHER